MSSPTELNGYCATCFWWDEWWTKKDEWDGGADDQPESSDQVGDDKRLGHCHRYPPTIFENGFDKDSHSHISTTATDYCGEHKPVEERS